MNEVALRIFDLDNFERYLCIQNQSVEGKGILFAFIRQYLAPKNLLEEERLLLGLLFRRILQNQS